MGRRLVVGTAGHIDHGKTALVRALTGVDTDRWEEEKRRGITIDLGFAPLDLGPDIEASVVDVPGHEGFVRNMLAGATGIDLALLVVAADEGLMPQTEEHLAILELLGVRRGIPVLTKCDAVALDWLALVREEVDARLAPPRSRITWGPTVTTSAVTGAGLPALRVALRQMAADLDPRSETDLFRLPVDRVFAVAGAGTVITGTTWSGSVAVGDTVRLLPADRDARVRSIEVHGQAAGRALPGRRTALAVVGVGKNELARGHVAVTGAGWRATTMLDAHLELLPTAPRPLLNRARVRVHLGTAEVFGRVAVGSPVAPGRRASARIALEGPLVARGGDRFVLRSFSPVTTIGGGVVTDPLPPVARRGRPTPPELEPAARVGAWLEGVGLSGLDRRELPVRLGVPPADAAAIEHRLEATGLRRGDVLLGRAAAAAEAARLAGVVAAHHEAHPLDPGMSLQALRTAIRGPGGPVVAEVADLVCERAAVDGALVIHGAVVHLPGWAPRLDRRATEARERLLARLTTARWEIPTVSELEQELVGTPVRALLAHLQREGGVEPLDAERYATAASLGSFRDALEQALAALGSATPADLRQRLGLTRKYLIPLLEWADRRGITRRSGDARTLASLTGRRNHP